MFPYRGVGGVSVLFYRVARYLAANKLAEPILVDFEDGAMANLVRSGDDELSFAYYTEESELTIPENAYAVFQSMTPWSIFPNIRFHSNTRLLFWNCHPYNLILPIPFFRIISYRFKTLSRCFELTLLKSWKKWLVRFIRTIHKKEGIVFMDEENLRKTEICNDLSLNRASFLPIPVDLPECNSKNTFRNVNEDIRFTWIGRLVDFKFYPLKRFLISMNSYAYQRSIIFEFSVIGSGPFIRKLKKLAESLNSVRVKFFGDMELSDVKTFIKLNTDIVVAMGTSALEGASLSKPTVLLDLSYKNIPENYKFKWLYETTGYNLAEEVCKKHLGSSNNSFSQLISIYIKDPHSLSNLCFNHVANNHSLSKVSLELVNFLMKSKLNARHIKINDNRKSIIMSYRVYSFFRNARDIWKGK